jgi:microcystin-dependent protein
MALIGAQYVQAVDPNPVGSLQAFAGANAPTGWLLCDGSERPIATYPELYSVLSTTYGALTNGTGGAGSTHFRVPDLRGRMPIGAGNENVTGNNTARNLGVKGGDIRLQSHTHTTPSHTHAMNPGGFAPLGISGPGVSGLAGGGSQFSTIATTGGASPTTNDHNQSIGTGANMPPFLVTNYIIKATSSIPRGGTALGSTPPIVTALPANPQFGEVVTYAADATNGIYWTLQYDASGTYPWKFVGGAPLHREAPGNALTIVGGTSGTAWQSMNGIISATTLSLPGDYTLMANCHIGTQSSAVYSAFAGFVIGGVNPSDNDSAQCAFNSQWEGATVSVWRRKTLTAANTTVGLAGRIDSASVTAAFTKPVYQITPIRVSA